MKTKPFPAAGILAAVIIAGASLSIFTPMCCATIHWNGSLLAAGRSWNNYANWRELRTPQQGEDIVFPMEAFRFDTDNNMTAGMRFGRIILETNGVTITGNALGLLNGIECRAVSTTGENRIEVPIALAGALIQDVNVSRTTRLILSRVVSGSGGISKTGLGTLVFNGNDGDNTYAGDT